jgi:hypothetical protein
MKRWRRRGERRSNDQAKSNNADRSIGPQLVRFGGLAAELLCGGNDSATPAARALLVARILMLLPGACMVVRSAPTEDDAGLAFTEVVTLRHPQQWRRCGVD